MTQPERHAFLRLRSHETGGAVYTITVRILSHLGTCNVSPFHFAPTIRDVFLVEEIVTGRMYHLQGSVPAVVGMDLSAPWSVL